MTLDEYMRTNGIKTGDLADILDVDQSYVSHMRARRKRPSLPIAIKLSKLTGLPIETFMEKAA